MIVHSGECQPWQDLPSSIQSEVDLRHFARHGRLLLPFSQFFTTRRSMILAELPLDCRVRIVSTEYPMLAAAVRFCSSLATVLERCWCRFRVCSLLYANIRCHEG
jgi:hypothetical protein